MRNPSAEQGWITAIGKIEFPKRKRWQRYVDSKRLEITCGEAPYLVSRYDTTTGEIIPIGDRIGILDRKLRIVGENTSSESTWLNWTYRAFQPAINLYRLPTGQMAPGTNPQRA